MTFLIIAACSNSAKPGGPSLSFSDHPVTAEEHNALNNRPPPLPGTKGGFGEGTGVLATQSGRLLDIGLEFGICVGQTAKVASVVREGPDRLVVTVRRTPKARPVCAGVGMFRGLSVTLPSDDPFTGRIEVRDATSQ